MSNVDNFDLVFPKDSSARKISSAARAIVPATLNTNHWEFHEYTGQDVGCDLVIELIENDEFKNKKIECQIKGTKKLRISANGTYVSFDFPVKTANYALNGYVPFVLFLVEVANKTVYWLSIKDYALKNREFVEKLRKNKNSVAVNIPIINIFSMDNDSELCELAKNGHL